MQQIRIMLSVSGGAGKVGEVMKIKGWNKDSEVIYARVPIHFVCS